MRLVVGYPPGGVTDIVARIIGQWLSERLNQAFVIDNRPGAGSNIAAEAVVRAPADFSKVIAEETEKWGKVIRANNIKTE